MSLKKIHRFMLAAVTTIFAANCAAAKRIDAAEFNSVDQLQRPANLDEWIFVGAIVGHGYPNGDARHFSAASPGRIQVVQMEPRAYRYLQQHGEYADGTMLALSFYATQENPAPVVDGVVQGQRAGEFRDSPAGQTAIRRSQRLLFIFQRRQRRVDDSRRQQLRCLSPRRRRLRRHLCAVLSIPAPAPAAARRAGRGSLN